MKVLLSRLAKEDLREIAVYTFVKWGKEQRDKYLRLLNKSFGDLATDPFKGKDCSEIKSGYRRYSIGSHVIFFRLNAAEEIEIIRVLHKRMDPNVQKFEQM